MARLLIVDDDPDILKMSEQILAHAGHEAIVASDALKAIDILDQSPFDILISDANMPICSGFEFVQTVRANPRHQDLIIVMLTGLRERKDVEKAVKAGVNDYIVKPLDPLLFVQKINTLLERHQPESKLEIRFAPETQQNLATVEVQVRLESISELGLVLRSNQPFLEGQNIKLEASFFEQLGDDIPPLKALSVSALDDGVFRVEVMFLGASEAFLQKIRRYIFQHGATHKAVS